MMGGIVREYVAQARLRGQEMFCPLTHKGGNAQVDFGEGLAIIGESAFFL